MSAAKEIFAQIEELFRENAKSYVTFEQLVRLFDKAPTAGLIKKIDKEAIAHGIE